jgi:hypothetical protein
MTVLCLCFMFFCLSFIVHLMFVFLFCMSLLCALCFCIVLYICLLMYIVVFFLFVYKCTDHCHRVTTQSQLINIIYKSAMVPTAASDTPLTWGPQIRGESNPYPPILFMLQLNIFIIPLRFPNQFSLLPHACHVSYPSHSPCPNHPNTWAKSTDHEALHAILSRISFFFGPKYLPQYPVLKRPDSELPLMCELHIHIKRQEN